MHRLPGVLVAFLAVHPVLAFADVVEAKKGAIVRVSPAVSASERGAVLKGARFEVLEQQKGKGCKKPWLRIGTSAWVCGDMFRASKETPGGDKLPEVPADRITPFEYVVGRDVTLYPTLSDAKSDTNGTKTVGKRGYKVLQRKKRFVRTAEGWLSLDDAHIARPSTWQGVHLQPNSLPIAFVSAEPGPYLLDAKGRRWKGESPVTFRQAITAPGEVSELGSGVRAYQVAEGVYLDARALTIVTLTARPQGVSANEHWLDVSIGGQILVAYEGDKPVYATLVSTAKNTPRGLQRIDSKRPHPTLQSTEKYSDKNKYHYEVPWVMGLAGRYALHSAYWHDDFGDNAGNGCVNLAPLDAAWIWDFTEPALPAGWSYATAVDTEGTRGSPVLIRD